MNDIFDNRARIALSNLLASIAKQDDAPASSEAHLATSIGILSYMTAWRPPKGGEYEEILSDYLKVYATLPARTP